MGIFPKNNKHKDFILLSNNLIELSNLLKLTMGKLKNIDKHENILEIEDIFNWNLYSGLKS